MKHILANETLRILIIIGVKRYLTSPQSNIHIPGLYIVTLITKKSKRSPTLIKEQGYFNINTTTSKYEKELDTYLGNIRRSFRLKTKTKLGDDVEVIEKGIRQITHEYVSTEGAFFKNRRKSYL